MLNTVHALSSLISSPLLPDGAPLPGPQSGLVSNTWKWSVSGDTCWLSERLYWDGMARQRAAGSGDPGELLCHVFTVSGFRIMGFISRLSLAHHLPVPIFRMTVVLPVGTHISQPRWILSWGPLGGWQDILWACTSSLLLAPPKFCQFSAAAPCSLWGPPVVRQLVRMQVVIIVPEQSRWFQSMLP